MHSSVIPHSRPDNDDIDALHRIGLPDNVGVGHPIVFESEFDPRSTIRIETLQISHQDTKQALSCHGRTHNDDITTTNCRITISDLTFGKSRVLHCQSQICNMTTSHAPHGSHRVSCVHLSAQFSILMESICINKTDNDTIGLPDAYTLSIELEAARSGHWPPHIAHEFGTPTFTDDRQLILSCQFNSIFGKHASRVSVTSGYSSQRETYLTNYFMSVGMSLPEDLNEISLGKASNSSITAVQSNASPCAATHFEPVVPNNMQAIKDAKWSIGASVGRHGSCTQFNRDTSALNIRGAEFNIVKFHDHTSIEDPNGTHYGHGVSGFNCIDATSGIDPTNGQFAEEPNHECKTEKDQTSSRSLRARQKNKVYNLKVLSDRALRREKKQSARGVGEVTYLIPVNQPICLDYFR
ncbi:hypothetical protein S7711_10232 [Stachybotrys chartarum IBT 7711]|uniref:Uncharacterized protein n=1 Tax=Stachybotrys chartarum (strain CBS 109288 / IBT 7711) TaxID=1280523 RepID=A0A084B5Q2_STACB|nr:hypothetical protein S7711_10232 [Stachybotrys chartarum IBT 7711]